MPGICQRVPGLFVGSCARLSDTVRWHPHLCARLSPYFVNDDLTLRENLGAWNRLYGTLFIEQPIGVGFSKKGEQRGAGRARCFWSRWRRAHPRPPGRQRIE